MDQIAFNDTRLVLKVKRSNLFVRILLYIITFLSAALPIGGFVVNFVHGGTFEFSHLICLLLSGLIFFFILRISLWNTCGKEVIIMLDNKLIYTADYNWFKDKVKEFTFNKIQYTLRQVGYEEDNKGVLVINFDKKITLETVTKLDLVALTALIAQLNKNCNSNLNYGNTYNSFYYFDDYTFRL
ncbi:hypothetical protein HX004_14455 [Myroides sp. 1354]|uniref:hypothetical protein n=1 Tax=unclassified Myroides TaxID=2642485 RepID=UPI0025767E03|nr:MULTISPECIES: hypothetical protein [unclassified Myroides]MDM1046028.1 hypothetical protein [Myroides sp. R163-1]MDM1056964.1 hypothetical protein [Myroides sp. 1354]MDM1070159.1 hypothetical protein [Myroides sp. 1372]